MPRTRTRTRTRGDSAESRPRAAARDGRRPARVGGRPAGPDGRAAGEDPPGPRRLRREVPGPARRPPRPAPRGVRGPRRRPHPRAARPGQGRRRGAGRDDQGGHREAQVAGSRRPARLDRGSARVGGRRARPLRRAAGEDPRIVPALRAEVSRAARRASQARRGRAEGRRRGVDPRATREGAALCRGPRRAGGGGPVDRRPIAGRGRQARPHRRPAVEDRRGTRVLRR